MTHGSVTQEYLLCALYPKGKIPTFQSVELTTCLVAGGLLELLRSRTISMDEKNRLVVTKPLSDREAHLGPVYEIIVRERNPKMENLAEKYVFCSGKLLDEWMEALCKPLIADGAVMETAAGLFGHSKRFVPEQGEVQKVIEKLRADFLEDGPVDDETVILGALLHKSGLLKLYFSKFEAGQMKQRIEELKHSHSGQIIKELVDYMDTMVAVIASVGGAGGL